MKKNRFKIAVAMLVAVIGLAVVFEGLAEARAGGSRSSGSRGMRSNSAPNTSYSRPAPTPPRESVAPPAAAQRPSPFAQPQMAGGGFMRSMAGGIVGGVLGGMLFRSLGLAGPGGGMGGAGGSGIGLFEIILIAGIGYLIYRMVKKRREEQQTQTYPPVYEQPAQRDNVIPMFSQAQSALPEPDDVDNGLAHIRQMDPYFDEKRFNDGVMDMFFKIQGAWMNRDLTSVNSILTDEMRGIFQTEINKMLNDKTTNRLENIAVRSVEVNEAWQESGSDYVTARIYANLLDYTTDDASGQVVSGSKTEPVKFEEYWTFTRPVGNNPWKLSAIQQA